MALHQELRVLLRTRTCFEPRESLETRAEGPENDEETQQKRLKTACREGSQPCLWPADRHSDPQQGIFLNLTDSAPAEPPVQACKEMRPPS